jgi:hypothetical protein
MFGLFGKKIVENDTFNNMLISAFSDTVKRTGRMPNEDEMFESFERLLSSKGAKLNQQQVGAIELCALTLKMGDLAATLLPLVQRLSIEIPRGERKAYDEITTVLKRNGLIIDEADLQFLKRFE